MEGRAPVVRKVRLPKGAALQCGGTLQGFACDTGAFDEEEEETAAEEAAAEEEEEEEQQKKPLPDRVDA